MNFVKNNKTVIVLGLLWLATVLLMAQDYQNYPPDYIHNRGNIEGSLFLYAFISLLELIIGILFIKYFHALNLYIRITTIVLAISFCFLAFVNTMHGGGVLALHAMWFSLEVFILFISLTIDYLKAKKIRT